MLNCRSVYSFSSPILVSISVEINGNSRHVIGYLKDFLFSPKQMNTPVSTLSAGERNRLMLARLFTRPFNLLVMDEPTNDLDMDTLELLEELLSQYQGTLLLVSHDRSFIDNLVDYCLVFEGHARVNEYVGGYQDWLRQRPAPAADTTAAASKPVKPKAQKARQKKQRHADQCNHGDDLPDHDREPLVERGPVEPHHLLGGKMGQQQRAGNKASCQPAPSEEIAFASISLSTRFAPADPCDQRHDSDAAQQCECQ